VSVTGRRGRPPRVSRDDIADAVVSVGFSALTFAAVREHLGVGETTLYRHAPDRDHLVRLGLDLIIENANWPSLGGDWESVLRRYACAAWNLFADHPGSAGEVSRGVVPFGIMRLLDDLCAVLMRAGFSAENAVLACDVVFDLVADNRRGVEHFDSVTVGSECSGTPRQLLERAWSAAASASEDSATDVEREAIHAAIHGSIVAEPYAWFTGKLEVVLAGVRHALAP
jgi:AcrR family transcriptional regulator